MDLSSKESREISVNIDSNAPMKTLAHFSRSPRRMRHRVLFISLSVDWQTNYHAQHFTGHTHRYLCFSKATEVHTTN